MTSSRFTNEDLTTTVLFKVDVAGGTRLREKYRDEEVQECLRLYHDAVERLALAYGAGGISFQGDGAVCYFSGETAVESAIEVAFQLLESIRTLPKFELHIRIALGVDDLPKQTDFGKSVSHQFNLAGHAEKVCPEDSVAITEEVYLALGCRADLANKFEYYGTTVADRGAVFIFPRGRQRAKPELFLPDFEDPYPAKASLLNYYRSPEFRLLRFRGVRQFDRVGVAVDVREAYVDLKARPMEEPSREDRVKDRLKLRRLDKEVMPRLMDTHPRPVREALKSARSLVVLGDPGSGKTTFLRWLALVASDGKRSTRRHLGMEIESIPLFIGMGRLWSLFKERNDGDILKALEEYFVGLAPQAISRRIAPLLERGECLFLLDGMDEVPDARDRAEAARLVERMMSSLFPLNRFVVTSRIMGYPYLNVPESVTLILEPLEKEQAEDLAKHFYGALEKGDGSSEKANKEAHDLVDQLAPRETLNPFLTNPLLLTLAAIVHTQLGRLPRYRARLYDVACQTLVDAWAEIRRTGDPTPVKERIDYEMEGLRVLPHLALWFHRHKPAGLAAKNDVVKQIASRLPKTATDSSQAATKFLDGLSKAGALLLDRGNDQWGFAHQTFQEYLAAKALAVSEAKVYKKELRVRLYDTRYAEVWRFLSGEFSVVQQRSKAAAQVIQYIFSNQDKFQARLLRKNVLLAVGCLSDSVVADDRLSLKIADALVGLVLDQSLLPPQEAVIASLRQLVGTPEAKLCIEQLLSRSFDSQSIIRRSAAYALGQLGATEAAPTFVAFLKDEKHGVRRSAADALSELGAKEAAPAILELLKDQYPGVRGSAAIALGRLGVTEAAHAIVKLLQDQEPGVRWCATDALAHLGAKEAAPAIVRLLKDQERGVRASAAGALGQLGAKDIAPAIVELLKDKHPGVRASAAGALGHLGVKAAASGIVELLRDKDSDVRASAAAALGQLGAKEAAHAIVELLKDEADIVRFFATVTLGMLEAKETAPEIVALLKDKDHGVRQSAAFALGQLGANEMAPEIVALLKDKDPGVRQSAAYALDRLGAKDASSEFVKLLKDKDPSIRWIAADALGKLGVREATPEIVALLKDEDPRVRGRAAEALASLGHTQSIPRIRMTFMKEENQQTRATLSQALWKLSFLVTEPRKARSRKKRQIKKRRRKD